MLRYLSNSRFADWRRKLQQASADGETADAKCSLQRLVSELMILNESAAHRPEQGVEEMLRLHRLNLHVELRRSLNTTNLIESVTSQIERETDRVDHWRTSSPSHRWCVATLLQIETKSRRVRAVKF